MNPGTDTVPPLAAAQNALAGMEVACDTCAAVTDKEGWARGCPDCEGEGTRPLFPSLRVACRGNSISTCIDGRRTADSRICKECQGRGWVPNRDWGAVRQAALETGWWLSSRQEQPGDRAWLVDKEGVQIGLCKPEWGLRDQAAETEALRRAAVAWREAQEDLA